MLKNFLKLMAFMLLLSFSFSAFAVEELLLQDVILEKAVSKIAEQSFEKLNKAKLANPDKFKNIKNIALYYIENDVKHIAYDILLQELTNKTDFQVIERNKLKDIILGQKIETSGLFEKDTIIKVGKLAGVNAIISGTIKTQKNVMGVINLRMNLKMHNIQTGNIIWTTESTFEYKTELGKYRNVFLVIIGVLIIMLLWWGITRIPKGITGAAKKISEGLDYSSPESRLHSDSMIRNKISRELKKSEIVLNDIIINLDKINKTSEAVKYNELKKNIDILSRKIEYASYGSSLFFKNKKIDKKIFNRMLEFDKSLLEDINVFNELINKISDYVNDGQNTAAQKLCEELSRTITRLSNKFMNRKDYLTGLS